MRSTYRAGLRSSCRQSDGVVRSRNTVRFSFAQGHVGRYRVGRRALRMRAGFTLLEIMIATAITLLMMISMVQVFKVIGDSMKQGRAALQMNNTLRTVTSRLRQDLANLTVRVDPPSDTSSGGGYFMYYDGSMTDYTAALFAGDAPRSNRFGDTDDILMFTARAGSSWFTGQVPGYIVSGLAADTAPVVITSQLAEIAVFARPVTSPATGVGFDDFDSNNFPDSFRLHYRVLLIRPDLNTVGTTAQRTLPILSVASGTDNSTTMATYFANCDLSMRRVYDGNSAVNDLFAANSLEDLANPANRFAHYQFPLIPIAVGSNGSCSMPLLVLDSAANSTVFRTGLYPEQDASTLPVDLAHAAGHYLAPEYVLGGDRTGEDVIANNILAFDIKGFDPGAPIIATTGADNEFGVQISVSPAAWSQIAGQDGSDDLILSPNDPGYVAAFDVTGVRAPRVVSYGEYVDLMWGRKALNALQGLSLTYTSNMSTNAPNLFTALSGIESAPTLTYGDGLIRSGKSLIHTNGADSYTILQPTYDTWTTAFESNGTAQTRLSAISGIAADSGTIDVNLMGRRNGFGGVDAAQPIDLGTDGLDNNSPVSPFTPIGGVDDVTERETSPPFPVRLRGVKISVRIEDLNSRQVKQMSIANEFATQ